MYLVIPLYICPVKIKLFAILAVLVALVAAAGLLLYRVFFPDGVGPSGAFDDEGGEANGKNTTTMDMGDRFKDAPFLLRYFKVSEFDSPDAPGSGDQMRISTLKMLDEAREKAGIPFTVSKGGGFRTPAFNASLRPRSAPRSSHMGGYAADIQARDRGTQLAILRALREVGFNRFGIYETFIHVDNDPNKTPNVAWKGDKKGYPKGSDFSALGFPFDPFNF